MFGIMTVSWLYTRVYLYGAIIWSTYTEPELYVSHFKLDPINGYWFPHFVKYIILGLMIGLYLLILFWTVLIFKVLYGAITLPQGKDIRSDDEDEEEQEEKPKHDVAIEKIEG